MNVGQSVWRPPDHWGKWQHIEIGGNGWRLMVDAQAQDDVAMADLVRTLDNFRDTLRGQFET